MTFTARLHLQPKVGISGAEPVLRLYTFKASTGGKLYFYLLNHFATHILRYYYCHIITFSLSPSPPLSLLTNNCLSFSVYFLVASKKGFIYKLYFPQLTQF